MDPMEVDLSFDSDKVRDFLCTKHKNVEKRNAKLREDIRLRKSVIDTCLQDLNSSNINVQVKLEWKRIYNDKFIVGFSLRNADTTSACFNNLVLQWNSNHPLTYHYSLCDVKVQTAITFSKSVEPKQEAILIVVIKSLRFLEQLTYEINGVILLKIKEVKSCITLPSFSISCGDLLDHSMVVQPCSILEGLPCDLICAIVGNKYEDLVLFGEQLAALVNILEIDCCLRKVKVECKSQYFLAHNLSPLIDGGLVELWEEVRSQLDFCEDGAVGGFKCKIYGRNSDAILGLIHHLYRNTKSISILPLKDVQFGNFPKKDDVDRLKTNLKREVEFVQRYQNDDAIKRKEVEFLELQKATDREYVSTIGTKTS